MLNLVALRRRQRAALISQFGVKYLVVEHPNNKCVLVSTLHVNETDSNLSLAVLAFTCK